MKCRLLLKWTDVCTKCGIALGYTYLVKRHWLTFLISETTLYKYYLYFYRLCLLHHAYFRFYGLFGIVGYFMACKKSFIGTLNFWRGRERTCNLLFPKVMKVKLIVNECIQVIDYLWSCVFYWELAMGRTI